MLHVVWPRPAVPRVPAPVAGYRWPVPPQETLKDSKAGLAQSLWGLLVHTTFCLSPPSISGGYGVWFEMRFHLSYHLAGASPLHLDVRCLFLVGSNILLLMVAQQWVVILKFSQEKMSAHPSTPPSCTAIHKSEKGRQILYGVSYMWNLKKAELIKKKTVKWWLPVSEGGK